MCALTNKNSAIVLGHLCKKCDNEEPITDSSVIVGKIG
jgi:hypothetical protein